MERLGVSVAFMERFIAEFKTLVVDSLATTREVDEAVVSSLNTGRYEGSDSAASLGDDAVAGGERQIPYLQRFEGMIDAHGQPLVARANVFVSHAWDTPLHGTLMAMQAAAQSMPRPYFWLDLFCYHREPGRSLAAEVWPSLLPLLKDVGVLLVVLSPWHAPLWPSRAWCLAEFSAAIQAQIPVELVFPPLEAGSFFDAVVRDPGRVLAQLAMIEPLEGAGAYSSQDAATLITYLREAGSARIAAELNMAVRSWLLRSIQRREAAAAQGASAAGALELGQLHNCLGYLCDDMHAFPTAVEHYEHALRAFQQQPDRHRLDVAATLNNLGAAHSNSGALDSAIARYEEALAILRKSMGADHLSVATAHTNLADAYMARGDPKLAVEQYSQALDIQLRTLDHDDPELAGTHASLGACFLQLGEPDGALRHFTRELSIALERNVHRGEAGGASQISLALAHEHMASSLMALQKWVAAEGHCREALALHDQSPLAAQIWVLLAHVFEQKRDFAASADALRQRLRVIRSAGASEPEVALACVDLADALMATGDIVAAIQQYQRALSLQRQSIGEQDSAIEATYEKLTAAYDQQNRGSTLLPKKDREELASTENAAPHRSKSPQKSKSGGGVLHPPVNRRASRSVPFLYEPTSPVVTPGALPSGAKPTAIASSVTDDLIASIKASSAEETPLKSSTVVDILSNDGHSSAETSPAKAARPSGLKLPRQIPVFARLPPATLQASSSLASPLKSSQSFSVKGDILVSGALAKSNTFIISPKAHDAARDSRPQPTLQNLSPDVTKSSKGLSTFREDALRSRSLPPSSLVGDVASTGEKIDPPMDNTVAAFALSPATLERHAATTMMASPLSCFDPDAAPAFAVAPSQTAILRATPGPSPARRSNAPSMTPTKALLPPQNSVPRSAGSSPAASPESVPRGKPNSRLPSRVSRPPN